MPPFYLCNWYFLWLRLEQVFQFGCVHLHWFQFGPKWISAALVVPVLRLCGMDLKHGQRCRHFHESPWHTLFYVSNWWENMKNATFNRNIRNMMGPVSGPFIVKADFETKLEFAAWHWAISTSFVEDETKSLIFIFLPGVQPNSLVQLTLPKPSLL